jgi:purine-binding chemotaxis protein CheW
MLLIMENDLLNSYLSFKLGNEEFAINVTQVLEILEVPPVTSIPLSPPGMRGVINLRGKSLPLLDMRTQLGMSAINDSINTCIIVLRITRGNNSNSILGAVVDGVEAVWDIKKSEIEKINHSDLQIDTSFLEGMVRLDDKFLIILNPDTMFSS